MAKAWKPVEDGFSRVEEQFEGRHTERVSVAQDWLTVGWRPESGEEYKASVQLPDNLRLCELVDVPDAPSVQMTSERAELAQQDAQPLTEAERDDLLLDADNAMRERAMQRATDAQPPSVQPLDMPDGPGWWGYTGRQQGVMWFTEFEIQGDMVAMRWGDDDYPMTHTLSWFKEYCRGLTFYRLTMPWSEQPAPAQESSEVGE